MLLVVGCVLRGVFGCRTLLVLCCVLFVVCLLSVLLVVRSALFALRCLL